MRLDGLASADVGAGARAGGIIAVPLGSTEQHGPHLPLSTDTVVAVALCNELARRRDDVLVAPALAYGSSGEHAGFAGTLSIGQQATELVVLELGRSAFDTFDRVVFVSGHGGNAEPVGRAVATLRAESRDVLTFFPRGYEDPHAGRAETSLLLALDDSLVRLDRAEAGATAPLAELLPAMRRGGVRAVSENGVLGDPAGSSAERGGELFERLASDLVAAVAAWADVAAVSP